ncbi:MAG: anti-sigma factor family protein [Gaiellaceae bacterium]
MAEKHPDELELLSYVEEELTADARRDVVEHLVACRACAESVRRLEAGRAALRASPLLELPEERRREALAALPERRDPWRPFRPVRRAILVAAPVAAAAAFVGVFVFAAVQLGGGDDADSEAGDAAQVAEEAGGGADTGRAEDSGTSAQALQERGEPVVSVAGPPAEVVRVLRREGIPAEVVEGAVVADSRAGEVEAALADRPAGPVEVYVR